MERQRTMVDNSRPAIQRPQHQQELQSTTTGPNTVLTTALPTASETAVCESIRHDSDLRIPYYCEENIWRLAYRKLYFQKHITQHQILNEIEKSTSIPNKINDKNINSERYYVVFISNPQKCVPMYNQRAAISLLSSSSPSSTRRNEKPCCFWDYHVILLGVTPISSATSCKNDDTNILVYDIDTTIMPYPVPLHQYLSLSFPLDYYSNNMNSSQYLQYKPYFRIVPAEKYIQFFASDRSHMYNEVTQSYNEPPPPYSCIAASPTSSHSITEGMCDEKRNEIQSNFQKYIDFTIIEGGENAGDSSANHFGSIVTLEQFIQYDF